MGKAIDKVEKIAVTTTAQEVKMHCKTFMIENLSSDAVYFKEKSADGVDATASNGFAVPGNTLIDEKFSADTLSIVGAGNCDVRILFLKEY